MSMLEADLPSSLRFDSQEFGPGTLTRQRGNYKVLERDGIKLKRHGSAANRTLHFFSSGETGNEHTAIVFIPDKEIDTVGLFSSGKPFRWVARNGIYIDVGAESSFAQYDFETGGLLKLDIAPQTYDRGFSMIMAPEDRKLVQDVCATLRNPHTPDVDMMREIIDLSQRVVPLTP